MYDINIKNVKKGYKIYIIVLLVGVLFLAIFGGYVIYNYIKLKSLDSTIMSTKVTVNSHIDDEGTRIYSPTYYYSVNGIEYFCDSNSSSSINPGTSNKTVYYDSKNPSNCMTEHSKSSIKYFLLFLLVPILFIVVAIINIVKTTKRIKQIKSLNNNGKLIKGLDYRLEDSGTTFNNRMIQRIVVDYIFPDGTKRTLYGDLLFDGGTSDSDGKVDLLIDENNPDNYYIDFEINRL